ncbi:DUF2490 domain-containing protein [Fulvivirga sp. M361]|uniref:DUF2490 domain-containing protein n=1 Tax=Fulvivirga sp. M361 TaxID=2594266 RepID=UPI00117BDE96|nr:DUF2490 domain-containing protein [Fulvivirga sp. M361]TRX48928.1 DUF2490 domain-containing protein [Fulvivirga sp. M361]
MIRRVLLAGILGLFFQSLQAQSGDLVAHWEMGVPISYKINDQWHMNTTLTGRNGFYDRNDAGDGIQFFSNFLEVTQYISRRVNQRLSLSLGYRHRRREPFEGKGLYENRLIQQLSYVHLRTASRLASRLQTEQRWGNEFFEYRIRYRLSMDRPFSGEKLDIGEYYFITANELVTAFPDEGGDSLENRVSVGAGKLWTRKLKLQMDLQLRSGDLYGKIDHRVFVLTSFYVNLK